MEFVIFTNSNVTEKEIGSGEFVIENNIIHVLIHDTYSEVMTLSTVDGVQYLWMVDVPRTRKKDIIAWLNSEDAVCEGSSVDFNFDDYSEWLNKVRKDLEAESGY